jgi:hypothetical protein
MKNLIQILCIGILFMFAMSCCTPAEPLKVALPEVHQGETRAYQGKVVRIFGTAKHNPEERKTYCWIDIHVKALGKLYLIGLHATNDEALKLANSLEHGGMVEFPIRFSISIYNSMKNDWDIISLPVFEPFTSKYSPYGKMPHEIGWLNAADIIVKKQGLPNP